MALPAIGVGQIVIAVDVTGLTGLGEMRTLQREFRRRVIKCRGLPGDGVVALRAVVIELCLGMIRLQCAVESGLVSFPAVGVGQVVIAVDVAGLAGLGEMRALKRKFRRRVIESGGLPRRRVWALRAVSIELCRGGIRLPCAV